MSDTGNLLDRVVTNIDTCGGRPRIQGTRIRVVDVLSMLSGGATHSEILASSPSLSKDDIRAAMLYATNTVEAVSENPSPADILNACKYQQSIIDDLVRRVESLETRTGLHEEE